MNTLTKALLALRVSRSFLNAKVLTKAVSVGLFLIGMSANVDMQAMEEQQQRRTPLSLRRIRTHEDGSKTPRPSCRKRYCRQFTCPFCFKKFARREFLHLHIYSCSPQPGSPSIAEHIEMDTDEGSSDESITPSRSTSPSTSEPTSPSSGFSNGSETERPSSPQFYCPFSYCYNGYYSQEERNLHIQSTHIVTRVR